MNKYQEFVSLVEEYGLNIKTERIYEPMSGWTGRIVQVCNGSKVIYDLSDGGFNFNDDKVELAIAAIKRYFKLKELDNFEAFKKHIYRMAEEVK